MGCCKQMNIDIANINSCQSPAANEGEHFDIAGSPQQGQILQGS